MEVILAFGIVSSVGALGVLVAYLYGESQR
jgi:hypothetical protein